MPEWLTEYDLNELFKKGVAVYPAEAKLTPSALDFARRNRMKAGSAETETKVAIASDHGGFPLKEELKKYLEAESIPFIDLGCHSKDAVDYPDYAAAAGRAVTSGKAALAIMIDTIGVASAMSANKIKGVRAAFCPVPEVAASARGHNDANVLTLGGKMDYDTAQKVVETFLKEPFLGGRHQRRVEKIMALER